MAWTASGIYYLAFRDMMTQTKAIDWDLTTNKIALYTNADTPNFDTEVSYSATNESTTGSGYTAGGQVVVSPAFDVATGTLGFDLGDQVWASPTTTTARGCKLYADALAGNDLMLGVNFGSDFTSTAGTFTIQWGTRVLTIDLTP